MAAIEEMYRGQFCEAEVQQNRTRLSQGAAESSSMVFHHLMPGVDMIFDHFDSHTCIEPEYGPESLDVLEINHCRQGRYGCLLADDRYVYLGEGEVEANILGIQRLRSEFPLGFYDGITITIAVQEALVPLRPLFPEIAARLTDLKASIEAGGGAMRIRSLPALEDIFQALYRSDPGLEPALCRVKVLELLLHMQTVSYDSRQTGYFKRRDLEKVKALRSEAVQQLERRIPFQQLAAQYQMGLTTAKDCFKEVYGMPYYTYMKHYRIHKALHYLEKRHWNVAQIAAMLGYDNASKFSAAFASIMGCTPREYRRTAQTDHCRLLGVEVEEE